MNRTWRTSLWTTAAFSVLIALNCAPVLPLRNLAKGAFSGIHEPKQEIIRDGSEWEKIWTKHSASARASGKIPAVDFNKEMIVLVTMGRQKTGGYAIEVAKVETAGERLKIFVKRTSPPPGAMAIQALTAPFHFVTVPKLDLKPEFVEEKSINTK
jgi:hypothetical protein